MRRNDTASIRQCLPNVASSIVQAGRALHSNSVANLCIPGGQAECRTVTSEDEQFCLQQFRCVVSCPVSLQLSAQHVCNARHGKQMCGAFSHTHSKHEASCRMLISTDMTGNLINPLITS